MRLKVRKKFLFFMAFLAATLLLLTLNPSVLYAAGATYEATGGANWNAYSGYGQHITATFDVTALAGSSAVLTVHANDVDEEQGEIDNVYFIETDGTEHLLGYLSGQNGIWTTTSFTLNKDWVKVGTSSIRVEPDVNNDGWLVTVDRAQLIIDGGVGQSGTITNLTLDDYDNSGANVSLHSTVTAFLNIAGSYTIETNLIDPDGNNQGTFFYSFTTGSDNEVITRTSNFTYSKSLISGTFTINAFLFDNDGVLQSTRSITFQHEQGYGVTGEQSGPSTSEGDLEEDLEVVHIPVRTNQMTCWQVWINEDNNFEFIFWWEYANNNWVKIYDMAGNEVFSIDMKKGSTCFEADLPDGMYTVKTFHDNYEAPIQEFIIGKP